MDRLGARSARALSALALSGALIAVTTGPVAASTRAGAGSASTFTAQVFASGAGLRHRTAKGLVPVSDPDDITSLGAHIFVGFQNGVGPQGQPSPTGDLDSTVVELDLTGRAVGQWDLAGKCDGLTADPATGELIATVNEDAHSSLYLITPGTGAIVHYRYNEALPSDGGTDAISVHNGTVLISASAPGTTGQPAPRAAYPAVYRAAFDPTTHVATVHPLFFDEARATVANRNSSSFGTVTRLALTDPDSNEDVPAFAPRFPGDFMLTSQGDKEQIFVQGAGSPGQVLSVLDLSASVDDTAWASDPSGALFATDNSANTVDKITGPFQRGEVLVAVTPCDANNAPAACPGPGFPDNYLGRLNPSTGVITRAVVTGPAVAVQGMLFRP